MSPAPSSPARGSSKAADGTAKTETVALREVNAIQPAELYFEYLDEANEGDLNAGSVLLTALSSCLNIAESRQQIQELERAGYGDDTLAHVRGNFRRCEPLLNMFPGIREQYDKWYQRLSAAEHPLVLVRRRGSSFEETKTLALLTISASYPEPHLYEQPYLAAARLYSEFPATLDNHRAKAWRLLACNANYRCNYEEQRAHLRSRYPAHAFDEITSIEADLRRAIEARDWASLF